MAKNKARDANGHGCSVTIVKPANGNPEIMLPYTAEGTSNGNIAAMWADIDSTGAVLINQPYDNWKYDLPANLSPGQHNILVTARTADEFPLLCWDGPRSFRVKARGE